MAFSFHVYVESVKELWGAIVSGIFQPAFRTPVGFLCPVNISLEMWKHFSAQEPSGSCNERCEPPP